MPTVGQPYTISATFTVAPNSVRLRYSGPGVASTLVTTGITGSGVGPYSYTVPVQTVSGVWLSRFEALDIGGNVIQAVDGSFVYTSSTFVNQPLGFPYPYGFILQNSTDLGAIRDAIGFQAVELPDVLLAEPEFEPAAEQWLMRVLPTWQLILSLAAPAAPVVAAQANASSQLPAASYYVRLVAKAGTTQSIPGAETGPVVITSGQQLAVTAPTSPGITAYDAYVGVAPGVEFLQPSLTSILPGQTISLTSFAMTGTPLQQVAYGEIVAMKAAVVAMTCSLLCRRFQRYAPAREKTMNYEVEYRHAWAEEEDAWRKKAYWYLGQMSAYVVTPAAALNRAHPLPQPTDPNYLGTDPLAQPGGLNRA